MQNVKQLAIHRASQFGRMEDLPFTSTLSREQWDDLAPTEGSMFTLYYWAHKGWDNGGGVTINDSIEDPGHVALAMTPRDCRARAVPTRTIDAYLHYARKKSLDAQEDAALAAAETIEEHLSKYVSHWAHLGENLELELTDALHGYLPACYTMMEDLDAEGRVPEYKISISWKEVEASGLDADAMFMRVQTMWKSWLRDYVKVEMEDRSIFAGGKVPRIHKGITDGSVYPDGWGEWRAAGVHCGKAIRDLLIEGIRAGVAESPTEGERLGFALRFARGDSASEFKSCKKDDAIARDLYHDLKEWARCVPIIDQLRWYGDPEKKGGMLVSLRVMAAKIMIQLAEHLSGPGPNGMPRSPFEVPFHAVVAFEELKEALKISSTGTMHPKPYLHGHDFDAASRVLAESYREDPVLQYICGESSLQKDLSETLAQRVIWFCVQSFPEGSVMIERSDIGNGPELQSIILCAPPPGSESIGAKLRGLSIAKFMFIQGGPQVFLRYVRVMIEFEEKRRNNIGKDAEYMMDFGTSAASRGHGLGSKVFQRAIARANMLGRGLYGEATSEKSVKLYLRHGAEVVERYRIDNGNGPGVTLMHLPYSGTRFIRSKL